MSDYDPDFGDESTDTDIVERPADAPAEPDEPELRYGSVLVFVEKHLVEMYRRDVSGQRLRWCPCWWAHGEAWSRLESLWRAWEHLRLDGATGMATWWKDYADPTMAVLFDPDGPFAGCSAERGHSPRHKPLPVEPMPDELLSWLITDPTKRGERPAAHTDRNER